MEFIQRISLFRLSIFGICTSRHRRCPVKEVFWKFQKFYRKTPVLESLFNDVASLQAGTLLKKRLKHNCFPVKFAKFLRMPILKNICQLLLLIAVTRARLRNHFFLRLSLSFYTVRKLLDPLFCDFFQYQRKFIRSLMVPSMKPLINFWGIGEADSELNQTSKTELLLKVVNTWEPLSIVVKKSILDVWLFHSKVLTI